MGTPTHRQPGKSRKAAVAKKVGAVSKHDRAWVTKYANRFAFHAKDATDEIERVSSEGLSPRDVQTFLAITREVAVQKFQDDEWDADQFLAWTLKWSDVALRAHKADAGVKDHGPRQLWVIQMGQPDANDAGDVITIAGK